MPSNPVIVPFPSEAAKKAKLFIPERYDPYQNQTCPRHCFLQYDQDNNALVLVADDTEEILDIFDFGDIVGASVGVELLGSEEPRASKAVVFENSTLEPPSKEADKDQDNVLKASYPKNAPTSVIPCDTQAAAKLTLFTYPRKDPSKDSIFSSCSGRKTYQAVKELESNKESKKLLHRYACHHIFQLAPVEDFDHISSVVKAIKELARPASRDGDRLLVIVNPFAGRKQGIEIFQSIVSPMLDQAGIEHDAIITTHAGHGEEAMAPKEKDVDGISDISKYTGLVAIGGDGSVYELFQGIRKRLDCEKILQTLTLGHIGAGTSNGLSSTLAHSSKVRAYHAAKAVFMNQFLLLHITDPTRRDSRLLITLSWLQRVTRFPWTCLATRQRQLNTYPSSPSVGRSLLMLTSSPRRCDGWVGYEWKCTRCGEF